MTGPIIAADTAAHEAESAAPFDDVEVKALRERFPVLERTLGAGAPLTYLDSAALERVR